MQFLYLALSIIGELIGTSLIKASEGFSKLYPTIGTLLVFTFSFFMLSMALKTIPLNIAYAIWSGLGIVATTAISVFIWKEKINVASVMGIILILVGVVVLNIFGPGHGLSEASESQNTEVNQTK